MPEPHGYKLLARSEHLHGGAKGVVSTTADADLVTATLILRRRTDGKALRDLEAFAPGQPRAPISRAQFLQDHGGDPAEMDQVAAYLRGQGLTVVETHPARRSIVFSGPAAKINTCFGVKLQTYASTRGRYRGHEGAALLPEAIAGLVETLTGLDNRQVPAQHYAMVKRHAADQDPPNTTPLTPQKVAQLYHFPTGNGAGQTIGIYEMQTGEGSAGYTAGDIKATMEGFGGGLTIATPTDVAVDGVGNAGVSDGETVLDITVASTIAQGAKIAVYFTGGTTQNIIHTLQRMIHPDAGDPEPNILSISYGWGPDDETADSFSEAEYSTLSQLFQEAANLGITVLVSSGDSGALIADPKQAQASYPASEPWVIACGGTTIGDVAGGAFSEYVWNDSWQGGQGATGGGISARFPLPSYQNAAGVPVRIGDLQAGRGIPDVSGNASVNSGYPLVVGGGQPGTTGGTSAVAPLYAGLLAVINANLGAPVGFINPILYSLPATTFHDITAPPGPLNNSFKRVKGYPVTKGWDACTGLGSVDGDMLQAGLKAALAKAAPTPATQNQNH